MINHRGAVVVKSGTEEEARMTRRPPSRPAPHQTFLPDTPRPSVSRVPLLASVVGRSDSCPGDQNIHDSSMQPGGGHASISAGVRARFSLLAFLHHVGRVNQLWSLIGIGGASSSGSWFSGEDACRGSSMKSGEDNCHGSSTKSGGGHTSISISAQLIVCFFLLSFFHHVDRVCQILLLFSSIVLGGFSSPSLTDSLAGSDGSGPLSMTDPG